MKKIRIMKLASIGIVAACICTSAMAVAPLPSGWYLEANGGGSRVTNANYAAGASLSSSGLGWNANGGYKFSPFFAGEVGYTQYANASSKVNSVKIANTSYYSYDIAGKGILPIGDTGAELFAKLGAAHLHSNTKATNTSYASTNGIVVSTGTSNANGYYFGLGADASDFVSIVPELQLSKKLPLRFIFPNAPFMPVTINNGYVMRAWYDIVSVSIENHADYAGIEKSTQQLRDLIQHEEQRGIPTNKIILAGFSQGAVIALTTGLTYSQRLGGIIALSGYLPQGNQLMKQATAVNQSIPIFLGHGTDDTIVPYSLAKSACELLQKNNYVVGWHTYRMPHSVCAEEIEDIAKALEKYLSE